jgi:hypothetical protein
MYSRGILGSCVAKIFFAPISHTAFCAAPSFVITANEMPGGRDDAEEAGRAAGEEEAPPGEAEEEEDGLFRFFALIAGRGRGDSEICVIYIIIEIPFRKLIHALQKP